ncbi:hypothetical protein [Burkholderia vietnamiensis]|uniref:hypothetical protein n=1 Tax=Burkholderia vietnamiensis TaxID=60552 RepID=UPI003300378F|nr:hypothetical protein [Burkholderia vietnamiensis]
MVIPALNTGMRRTELLALQWSEVILGGHAPTVAVQRENTAGEARRIPLDLGALDMLKVWKPPDHASHLFGNVESNLHIYDIKKPRESV